MMAERERNLTPVEQKRNKMVCLGNKCEHYSDGFCSISDVRVGPEYVCPYSLDIRNKVSETNNEPDMVNHPPHYTQGGIECIDAIKAMVVGKPPYEAWLVGQVGKYLWRYPDKNGLEDLKKAQFYLDRLIKEVENGHS